MSTLARTEFDNARILQTTQNDARGIFQRVLAAQQNPARAGNRWPFELIQNAHDAGPRTGNDRVEINFTLRDDRLVVSHTGKAFVAQELAALLSGGSSKEFDSEETTGRFGTGFLVTHAVSTDVSIDGVLTTQEGPEAFRIELKRDGNEDDIVTNIDQANDSLEMANPVQSSWLDNNPTAVFTYQNPDLKVVRRGLDRLEEALPYLYATCSKLGRVQVDRFGESRQYDPSDPHTTIKDDLVIHHTEVSIRTSSTSSSVTSVRIGATDCQSALLTVLNQDGTDGPIVSVPSDGFARVFVKFPIAGTEYLPFNVIIDGDFAVSQERDGIAMDSADRASMRAAMSAFPVLVEHAVTEGWCDAQELASLAPPARPLSGEVDSGELEWWQTTVMQAVRNTACRPIIATKDGFLPALPNREHPFVSFPVPAVDSDSAQTIEHDDFHELTSHVSDLNIPSHNVAESWCDIARQWAKCGLNLNRLGLSELTTWIKDSADSISALAITDDPYNWLARLYLLAAASNDHNVRGMINGLLPNEHGTLTDTRSHSLYLDGGIPETVKDIASILGDDIRSQLLHDTLARTLQSQGYELANQLAHDLLDTIDGGAYTESRALDLVLDRLETVLPNDSQFDNKSLTALCASARAAVHIARSHDTQRLRRCPLLTTANRIVHLSGSQQILSPVSKWPETAKSYADLYSANRILSGRYNSDDDFVESLEALIVAGIVIPAPLFEGRRAELSDINLLREMSLGEEDTADVTVRDAEFGQIAFLATDLVQRCGENGELAKLLLDFVLNVAARADQSWRQSDTFVGTRSGKRVSLTLTRAIWPFELKVRSWIPVKAPDADAVAPMPANESNLRELLDSSWLKNNRDAVNLLHRVFGFRQLTLLLDSLGTEVENDLVSLLQYPELVKAAADNPEVVKFASELKCSDVSLDSLRDFVQDAEEDDRLLEDLEKRRERRRQVHENQSLGAAIEELVSEQLKEAGFDVRRTGVGSDFEISVAVGDLADLHISRDDKSWLVEVKATRDQRVRMTATQARTAVHEGEHFLLCVVPVDSDDASKLSANMRFVSGLGERLANLCDDLGLFEGIRDEITAEVEAGVQLEISPGPARVRVANTVWENDGFPLEELTARLLQQQH